MDKSFLKEVIEKLVKKILSTSGIKDVDFLGVDSYPLPNDSKGTLLIVNLGSEKCIDEERKSSIEGKINFYFENGRDYIIYRAPFSASRNDKMMVNFIC